MARHKEKRRLRRHKKPRKVFTPAEPQRGQPQEHRKLIVGSVDKEKWHEDKWHDPLLFPIVAFFVWAGIASVVVYMLFKMIFKAVME
jgi:hypothetical protein